MKLLILDPQIYDGFIPFMIDLIHGLEGPINLFFSLLHRSYIIVKLLYFMEVMQVIIDNLKHMIIDNEQYSEIKSKLTLNNSKLVPHPSLIGGYTLLYDNNIPIDMKYVDYDRNVNHLGSNQIVNFKIYTFGMKPNIGKIKIQIQSENDLFFVSKFQCDQNFFSLIRKEQKLNITLQELPTIIIKCLNKIEQSKKKLNASLLIYSDGKSKLCLNYSSQFKNIQILHLDLNQQNDEKMQEIIKFKYQTLRKNIEKAEHRLTKINEIIRQKNPSLLHQIYKSTNIKKQ